MSDPQLAQKIDTSYTNSSIHASEPFLYVQDEFKATQKLTINAGLRLSGFISEEKSALMRNQDYQLIMQYFPTRT